MEFTSIPLLVLAGGFGTRLKSVVSELPKALAPVDGDPFLRLQIKSWVDQGIKSFIFLLHHKADLIVEFLNAERDGFLAGCEVKYLIEVSPMGTGGAIAYAVEKFGIEGNFLVANADTWLSSGVQKMMQAVAPSILVLKVTNASRYGAVKFGDDNFVAAFAEKIMEAKECWINAGLYLLCANLFEHWDHREFSLEKIMLPHLAQQGILRAEPMLVDFIDIGIPEDYRSFCSWVKSGRLNGL